MNESDWVILAKKEISQAVIARALGNEGKARVCARRAAGYILDEYIKQKGIQLPNSSALARLKYFGELPELAPQTKSLIDHLLLRVTREHDLPVDADLISDVRELAKQLMANNL
jgi:hypothetical protein